MKFGLFIFLFISLILNVTSASARDCLRGRDIMIHDLKTGRLDCDKKGSFEDTDSAFIFHFSYLDSARLFKNNPSRYIISYTDLNKKGNPQYKLICRVSDVCTLTIRKTVLSDDPEAIKCRAKPNSICNVMTTKKVLTNAYKFSFKKWFRNSESGVLNISKKRIVKITEGELNEINGY